MRQLARGLALVAVLAFALMAGWRILGLMQSERTAFVDPASALEWRAGDPQALLAIAERDMREGNPPAAAATARRLLAREPLEGRAFRILGEAAAHEGQQELALKLYLLAMHHAPRDIPARAWLAEHYLRKGDYAQALVQIDYVVRTSPGRTKAIYRILKRVAPMAQDPKFADALIETLLTNPPWRDLMLRFLGPYPEAADRVLEGMHDRNGLSSEEYGRWLGSLMSHGRWGEAFARWASQVVKPGQSIPLLYNGDFAIIPTGIGFDWMLGDQKGVVADVELGEDGQARVAHLQFQDERIADTGFQHALLLFPGRYRLSMRIRAQALHGEVGLRWSLRCAGKAGEIARGEPIYGSFDWRIHALEFVVPPSACGGQWLRLVNGAEKGQQGRISGEMWIRDVELHPLPGK